MYIQGYYDYHQGALECFLGGYEAGRVEWRAATCLVVTVKPSIYEHTSMGLTMVFEHTYVHTSESQRELITSKSKLNTHESMCTNCILGCRLYILATTVSH